ncbi:hypothetical protein [Cellulophaga baltica]|uniref:hypothetical protein n=1 Tax=Cellulophaga baltica TaxID=76594 RepID=UPI0003FEDB7A|nr:hypothetical protein [Cellulophaga baltica]WFO15273.1 hypothetical protein M601_015750 [Cellulophaga baltica 4]
MKKILLALLVLSSGLVSAQAYRTYNQNHELKFNIGLFLASSTVEGSYEYFLNEDTSIGGTLYFDNTPLNYNGNFGIGPNFRAYFGYAPRSGFFAEAFGLYYSGEIDDPEFTGSTLNNRYNTTAIGIGIGHKFATRSQKFTLEFNAGLGRNVNPQEYQNTFMYRAGLSVGFRF